MRRWVVQIKPGSGINIVNLILLSIEEFIFFCWFSATGLPFDPLQFHLFYTYFLIVTLKQSLGSPSYAYFVQSMSQISCPYSAASLKLIWNIHNKLILYGEEC
jgi:hypothetical protein